VRVATQYAPPLSSPRGYPSACAPPSRGKVLLRCVCSAARERLGRPRGEERGHIVSPRAQLVKLGQPFN